MSAQLQIEVPTARLHWCHIRSVEMPMSFQGHVQNGVVVFDEPAGLPEGTKVRVEPVTGKSPLVVRPGTGNWEAAAKAAQELRETGYDFDAFQKQREYDLEHASDHLP